MVRDSIHTNSIYVLWIDFHLWYITKTAPANTVTNMSGMSLIWMAEIKFLIHPMYLFTGHPFSIMGFSLPYNLPMEIHPSPLMHTVEDTRSYSILLWICWVQRGPPGASLVGTSDGWFSRLKINSKPLDKSFIKMNFCMPLEAAPRNGWLGPVIYG